LKDCLTNCDSVSWDFALFWISCGSVSAISFIVYISAFKHCSLIKSFNSLISSHDTESQFVRPRLHETGMKPNWNENLIWNVFVFTFIPVWIHAGLNSCRSEVSRLGPAGAMTWDWSELFLSRSHVNIYYK
jgi:hypothetical protein